VAAASRSEKAVNALARPLDQSFGRAQVEEGASVEDEMAPWEAMTPAQRAAWRADEVLS
jgi:hypothetical protein